MEENILNEINNLKLDSRMQILSRDLPHTLTILNIEDNSLVKLEAFHAVCLEMILAQQDSTILISTLRKQYLLEQTQCSLAVSELITFLLEQKILIKA